MFKIFLRTFVLIASLIISLTATPLAFASNEITATVNVAVLNLRAGPSKSSAVLTRLTEGQTVLVLGRSTNSYWLNVRSTEGLTGWVYEPMVNVSAAVETLPVTEARGGAAQPGTYTRYTFNMTIENNTATVTLNGFPAKGALTLALSRADGAGRLIVAQGAADANGNAQFTFTIPSRWADGQAVASGSLRLNIATGDQKINLNGTVQYVQGP